jgi:hypothetical protein
LERWRNVDDWRNRCSEKSTVRKQKEEREEGKENIEMLIVLSVPLLMPF